MTVSAINRALFFCQAEDGIRDDLVTGVQTCALPISVVAAVVFAPWAYRNLVVLGSPLPGQAVTNALYLSGYDIFAWKDPPTLARHLAIGPAALVGLRVAGLTHNLFNVLVILGIPISAIGLAAVGDRKSKRLNFS